MPMPNSWPDMSRIRTAEAGGLHATLRDIHQMKILILGLNYAPEPVGIGPYTTGLAEALAARGHRVDVLAGKPYYPQWRAYSGQPKGRTRTVENGVSITRVPHYIPAKPSGAKRIAHHLSFAASARAAAGPMLRSKPDLVFTIAPSLLSVPVAAGIARKAGVPLWLHVQDFEVEAAFATGLIKGGSGAAGLARSVENRIIGMADVVSTISPQMCERLAAKGVPAERIYELRNWSNAAFNFAEADPSTYRREWGLGDRKVALYSGNIANKQGLEIVIEAARLLRDRSDLAFVICGEGPNRERLSQLAAGLNNVQFHDLQPVERMADFLSLASIHLLPQIVGAADLVLPSKLTNMLASGRPVVATADVGTGLFDEVDGCGLNTSPGNAAALATAIAALADDDARRSELGMMAQARAAERWSQAAIIDRFETRLGTVQRKDR